MLWRYRIPVAVVCSFGLLVLAQGDVARGQFPGVQRQRRGMPKHAAAKAPLVEASGTIDAVAPGLIRIKTPIGQLWVLQVSRETKVRVTGTAKKDVLRPGSFIRFTADVDKPQSRAQDQVGKLTLFTPSRERPPGAFPDQKGLDLAAGDNAFGADLPGKKPRAKRKAARGKETRPPIERFEIFGQIRGISKEGKLTVYVPLNRYFKPPLEIELSEEPEIELDLTGISAFRLAKKGDEVEARGRQVSPATPLSPAAAQLTELTIKLAEPWTVVQPKKPVPRRPARSRRAKAEEAEEAVEAEEAKEADQDNP